MVNRLFQWRSLAVAGFLAFYLVGVLWPEWQRAQRVDLGKDYASYHYAAKAAHRGCDPYDVDLLGRIAQEEDTRSRVNPYLYAPPFLLAMSWSLPLSLQTGYRVFFWVNQLVLCLVLLVLFRWLAVSPLFLMVVLISYHPISDSIYMGQSNLLMLLLVCVGLWQRWSASIGAAAMIKLLPGLYLGLFALRKEWRSLTIAFATLVGLSLLTLPLVDAATQLDYYLDIVPGFSRGDYNGLRVPISLPNNHSIPDLLRQVWPNSDAGVLSHPARLAATATGITLLGFLAVAYWRQVNHKGAHADDRVTQGLWAGALMVIVTLMPVYTFNHHLVSLLLPLLALCAALQEGRLRWPWAFALAICYVVLATPRAEMQAAQDFVPALHWWLRESKSLAALFLLIACVKAAFASAVPRS